MNNIIDPYDYDDENRMFYGSRYLEIQDHIASTGNGAGNKVLDVVCRTGFITGGLLRIGALQTIVVDHSDEMLTFLQDKFIGAEGYVGLECRLGNANELPVEDNTVDSSFIGMSLNDFENPSQIISEMIRTTKSDGKIIIFDAEFANNTSKVFPGMEITQAETLLTEAGLLKMSTEKLGTLQNQDNLEASPYIISANVP